MTVLPSAHPTESSTDMDMQNKLVVITGANSGVGFVTARELAAAGAHVVMVCRDPERGSEARARLAEIAAGQVPDLLLCDLSSQAAIRSLSEELHASYEHIDVLLNNAGGVFTPRELSVDGIEKTFATNHLAPFLLTNLVLDLLRAAAPGARVVTVATEIYAKKLGFDNLQGEEHYQFFKAYQVSKLCNIAFAFELARRLEGTGVTSTAVSPGPSKTAFGNNITGAVGVALRTMKRMPMFGSAEKGARTLVMATSGAELEGVSGRFYFRSKEKKTKPVTHDLELADRLWRVSEQLTGLTSLPHAAATLTSHDATAGHER
jgi:NAD(P)-dependent dehydrogenase (short-subunit alcohol dehydrogenase family)